MQSMAGDSDIREQVDAVIADRIRRGDRPDLEEPEYGYSWSFGGRRYTARGLGPPPVRHAARPVEEHHAACLRWAYEAHDTGPWIGDPEFKRVPAFGKRPDGLGRLAFAIDAELRRGEP
jgi:hypothetical protein